MFENIRLYDKDGNPITIKYVCQQCGHEMKMPYCIIYPKDKYDPCIFYCKNCADGKVLCEKGNLK